MIRETTGHLVERGSSEDAHIGGSESASRPIIVQLNGLRLVVDRRIEAGLSGQPVAFLGSVRSADFAAAFDLRDLPNDRTQSLQPRLRRRRFRGAAQIPLYFFRAMSDA